VRLKVKPSSQGITSEAHELTEYRGSQTLSLNDKQNRAMSPIPAINIRNEEGFLDIIHRLLMTDKISNATSMEVAKATSARGFPSRRDGLSDRFFPLLSARGTETADGAWEDTG
jgi:hypothetical protein